MTIEAQSERPRLSITLVVLATILAMVATVTTWVRVQALDTDAWVELSDELIEQPEVQEALAVFLVDELYALLDIPTEVERGLPADLQGVANLAAAALRIPATEAVERALASERFREAWSRVNRAAHQTMVSILRDETGSAISAADGAVTLHLGVVLRLTANSLGLSGPRVDSIPDDAGSIIIFTSDELASAQRGVRVLEALSWFLFVLVVGMYTAAVLLASRTRVAMLRNVGIALIIGGVVVLLLRSLIVGALIDAVVEAPSKRGLANVIASIATGLIRDTAQSGIITGLLVVGCSALLGAGRLSRRARRLIAPAVNAPAGVVALGTGLVVLVLLWWSPAHAFERFVPGLIIVALLVGGVIALRSVIRRESAAGSASAEPLA